MSDGIEPQSRARKVIPAPPSSNSWLDILHWVLIAMETDDRDLAFAAGCLSHCAKYGGLTDKQAAFCGTIWDKFHAQYHAGFLDGANRD